MRYHVLYYKMLKYKNIKDEDHAGVTANPFNKNNNK